MINMQESKEGDSAATGTQPGKGADLYGEATLGRTCCPEQIAEATENSTCKL